MPGTIHVAKNPWVKVLALKLDIMNTVCETHTTEEKRLRQVVF